MRTDVTQNQFQAASNNPRRAHRNIRFRHQASRERRTEDAAAESTNANNGRSAEAPSDIFDPNDLASEDATERLRLFCDTNEGPVRFEVNGLLDWPTTARVGFFRFVAHLDQQFRIHAEGSDEEFIDAFEFVLAQMEGTVNIVRCQAGRQAALEAATVFYSGALLPACNRIVERLRELHVRGVRMEDILGEVRAIVESLLTGQDVEEFVRVQDVLPGVPTSANLVVPPGWILSPGGLSRSSSMVLHLPVVLTGRLIGEDGAELLEVAFQRDGRWEVREIPREQIADTRGVLSLARMGLPVNSTIARQLVEYFAAFETANRDFIPSRRVVDRTGWHTVDGNDIFMLGTTAIGPERPTVGGDANIVQFRARTPGDSELANAVRTSGTYAGWRSAISAIAPYPSAKLAFYTSLVPTVLPIMGAPSFCLDFSGATSCGKTTALRITTACWGYPGESESTIMLNWDTTSTFRQRAARMLGNLPLIIDETRLADSNDEVIQQVYSIVGGRGRGRGSRAGTEQRGNWSTVLITSGETSLTAMSNKGGARARTFSLWGSPFGATDNQTASMIDALNRGLVANYGHAGLAFVNHLVRYRNMWNTWREEYLDRVATLVRRAGDDSVACRMAAPLAAISVTTHIAHQALDLPWRHEDVVDQLWERLTEQSADANRAVAALEHVVDWARGNQGRFFGKGRPRDRQPLGGWPGRWDLDGDWIGIRPEVLRRVLHSGGFEFESTVRIWHDRNWILHDASSGKARHRTRIDRELCWVIAIRAAAIAEVESA